MPAPLPSTPLGAALFPGLRPTKAEVELFLDVNCPFSRRMFVALQDVFKAYEGKGVQFVLHNVIQPWHPAGCVMHEACLAVKSVSPGSFWAFVGAVFEHQEDFSDHHTYHKSRAQLTEELVALAEAVGVPQGALRDKLALTGTGGNSGTGATQLVKFATKLHRVRGVHVTPTVFVNGLEAGEVSSGWSGEQWRDFLDRVLAEPS